VKPRIRAIALLLILTLVVHPATVARVEAVPHLRDVDANGSGDSAEAKLAQAAGPAVESGAAAAKSTKANRATVTAKLIDLGYGAEEAAELASQLTPADLDVLASNPGMMQRAGDISQTTTAYIIGGLIVAGIVILAVNGSGFVSISS
jgi:hypothetical protein